LYVEVTLRTEGFDPKMLSPCIVILTQRHAEAQPTPLEVWRLVDATLAFAKRVEATLSAQLPELSGWIHLFFVFVLALKRFRSADVDAAIEGYISTLGEWGIQALALAHAHLIEDGPYI
jgi:hypothetical protein